MERLPIDLKLWTITSGALFGLLVVLDLAGEIGGGHSFGPNLRSWQAGSLTSRGFLEEVMPRAMMFGVVAVFVGWALHGLAVICGFRSGGEPSWENLFDYQEPSEDGVGPGIPWEERLARFADLKKRGELLSRGLRAPHAVLVDASSKPEPEAVERTIESSHCRE